ncbi:MAG TPA: hypothetical protein VGP93_11765 [Polyangiaceae bacterium]|jgi:hypothetical protein|nr:hypothetical protein [Polyangiaceae bacterium]
MQAPEIGGPAARSSERDETPVQALARLLEHHGLSDSAREMLEELEKRRRQRQIEGQRQVLDELMEGEPPFTPEELEAARREWRG